MLQVHENDRFPEREQAYTPDPRNKDQDPPLTEAVVHVENDCVVVAPWSGCGSRYERCRRSRRRLRYNSGLNQTSNSQGESRVLDKVAAQRFFAMRDPEKGQMDY